VKVVREGDREDHATLDVDEFGGYDEAVIELQRELKDHYGSYVDPAEIHTIDVHNAVSMTNNYLQTHDKVNPTDIKDDILKNLKLNLSEEQIEFIILKTILPKA
jgi:hypothetical protein